MRLGDVVMAAPNRDGQRFIYQYCQAAEVKDQCFRFHVKLFVNQVRETGEAVFETKSWCPPELSLQLLGEQLQQEVDILLTKDCLYYSSNSSPFKIAQLHVSLFRLRPTLLPRAGSRTSPPHSTSSSNPRAGNDLQQHRTSSSCRSEAET